MRFLAEFIMRGRMQAIMVASTLALISLLLPPVSIVSSAAVALVTLRRGAYQGLLVLLSSCAAAALLGWLLLGGYQFALFYGLVLWLPVWGIAILLRATRQLALAVEVAVLIGASGVLVAYLYQDNPAQMWLALLTRMANAMLEARPGASVENVGHTLSVLAHYMTGVVAAGSVYGLLFGLFLGRWWQAQLYNPGGFRQEYLALTTRPWVALLSMAVLALAWLGAGNVAEMAWNIVILLFVLYTFIGAAVVHVLLAGMKAGRFWVPMFYMTLFIVPYAMLPVALVGIGDAWWHLRDKFSK